MLPAALFLVVLTSTVMIGVLNRAYQGDQQKSLGLFKVEADYQARMGLESIVSRVRNFTAGPTAFAAWTTLSLDATEQSDARRCSISSQFALDSIVRMSPRFTSGDHHLRYYAITELDGAAGLTEFATQWRIVSCVLSESLGFTTSRSTLLRYGIQNNGVVTTRGSPIDMRGY